MKKLLDKKDEYSVLTLAFINFNMFGGSLETDK